MDATNINKIYVEKLQSRNYEEILLTLNQIRISGEVTIIPYTLELLNNKPGKAIEKAITELLNDIKIPAASVEIIKALKNPEYKDIQKPLLTACWSSGLDYSDHLDLFVDLFVIGSFEIALEAFTVIENMEIKHRNNRIDPLILELKNKSRTIGHEKSELMLELLQILENMADMSENLN